MRRKTIFFFFLLFFLTMPAFAGSPSPYNPNCESEGYNLLTIKIDAVRDGAVNNVGPILANHCYKVEICHANASFNQKFASDCALNPNAPQCRASWVYNSAGLRNNSRWNNYPLLYPYYADPVQGGNPNYNTVVYTQEAAYRDASASFNPASEFLLFGRRMKINFETGRITDMTTNSRGSGAEVGRILSAISNQYSNQFWNPIGLNSLESCDEKAHYDLPALNKSALAKPPAPQCTLQARNIAGNPISSVPKNYIFVIAPTIQRGSPVDAVLKYTTSSLQIKAGVGTGMYLLSSNAANVNSATYSYDIQDEFGQKGNCELTIPLTANLPNPPISCLSDRSAGSTDADYWMTIALSGGASFAPLSPVPSSTTPVWVFRSDADGTVRTVSPTPFQGSDVMGTVAHYTDKSAAQDHTFRIINRKADANLIQAQSVCPLNGASTNSIPAPTTSPLPEFPLDFSCTLSAVENPKDSSSYLLQVDLLNQESRKVTADNLALESFSTCADDDNSVIASVDPSRLSFRMSASYPKSQTSCKHDMWLKEVPPKGATRPGRRASCSKTVSFPNVNSNLPPAMAYPYFGCKVTTVPDAIDSSSYQLKISILNSYSALASGNNNKIVKADEVSINVASSCTGSSIDETAMTPGAESLSLVLNRKRPTNVGLCEHRVTMKELNSANGGPDSHSRRTAVCSVVYQNAGAGPAPSPTPVINYEYTMLIGTMQTDADGKPYNSFLDWTSYFINGTGTPNFDPRGDSRDPNLYNKITSKEETVLGARGGSPYSTANFFEYAHVNDGWAPRSYYITKANGSPNQCTAPLNNGNFKLKSSGCVRDINGQGCDVSLCLWEVNPQVSTPVGSQFRFMPASPSCASRSGFPNIVSNTRLITNGSSGLEAVCLLGSAGTPIIAVPTPTPTPTPTPPPVINYEYTMLIGTMQTDASGKPNNSVLDWKSYFINSTGSPNFDPRGDSRDPNLYNKITSKEETVLGARGGSPYSTANFFEYAHVNDGWAPRSYFITKANGAPNQCTPPLKNGNFELKSSGCVRDIYGKGCDVSLCLWEVNPRVKTPTGSQFRFMPASPSCASRSGFPNMVSNTRLITYGSSGLEAVCLLGSAGTPIIDVPPPAPVINYEYTMLVKTMNTTERGHASGATFDWSSYFINGTGTPNFDPQLRSNSKYITSKDETVLSGNSSWVNSSATLFEYAHVEDGWAPRSYSITKVNGPPSQCGATSEWNSRFRKLKSAGCQKRGPRGCVTSLCLWEVDPQVETPSGSKFRFSTGNPSCKSQTDFPILNSKVNGISTGPTFVQGLCLHGSKGTPPENSLFLPGWSVSYGNLGGSSSEGGNSPSAEQPPPATAPPLSGGSGNGSSPSAYYPPIADCNIYAAPNRYNPNLYDVSGEIVNGLPLDRMSAYLTNDQTVTPSELGSVSLTSDCGTPEANSVGTTTNLKFGLATYPLRGRTCNYHLTITESSSANGGNHPPRTASCSHTFVETPPVPLIRCQVDVEPAGSGKFNLRTTLINIPADNTPLATPADIKRVVVRNTCGLSTTGSKIDIRGNTFIANSQAFTSGPLHSHATETHQIEISTDISVITCLSPVAPITRCP